MDTGQSDFTDPPSPRQICYRILGRDIEDPPCEEGGGRDTEEGGPREDVSYRTRFLHHWWTAL